MSDTIAVEVAYAEPKVQIVVKLEVEPGTTAAQAIARADLTARHPGLPQGLIIGIWGRVVPAATVLAVGDRVELYRPLPKDPKLTRRELARQGRTMGPARVR